ncbi:MAG: hypothetical protein ACFFG0_09230 [Candidatus Thorarchaeota archaeon]
MKREDLIFDLMNKGLLSDEIKKIIEFRNKLDELWTEVRSLEKRKYIILHQIRELRLECKHESTLEGRADTYEPPYKICNICGAEL